MNFDQNLVIQGDNLQVMGDSFFSGLKIDFMLWDPPYNTGNTHFIYKDKNEKWLSFMEVRLQLANKLLKDTGVIAVHISYHELFRLGLLMDEVFGEDNRLGIINWECSYSPKNHNKGIPSTTDYILIYAKNKNLAYRGVIPRTAEMDARYKSPDKDPRAWSSDNLSSMKNPESYRYGIESPFTGDIHFPPEGSYWRRPKTIVKDILSEWGVEYIINSKGNCVIKKGQDRNKAKKKFANEPWPTIFFLGKNGEGRPRLKRYKDMLKNEGRIVGTYWEAHEVLDENWSTQDPLNLSLSHEISGHNDGAKKLMKAILGDKCAFDTPKPLKLTERLISMFCPKNGIVLDAFAGSATTAHAVLSLNAKDHDANRKFIMIEINEYVKDITCERIQRCIDGKWHSPRKDIKALGGNYLFIKIGALSKKESK